MENLNANWCVVYTRCSTSDNATFNQLIELIKITIRRGLIIAVEFEVASLNDLNRCHISDCRVKDLLLEALLIQRALMLSTI